jgi:hypothetical protein
VKSGETGWIIGDLSEGYEQIAEACLLKR